MKEIKGLLKKLRKQAGLTLREVEEAIGVSNAYISQLETGKIKKPSANVLYKLGTLYGCGIEPLLKDFGIIEESRIQPIMRTPSLEDQVKELAERIQALENKPTQTRFDDIKFCE